MAFAKLSQTIFKGIVDAEANLNKTINKVYKNVNEIKDIDLCNILEYIANQIGTAVMSKNKTINDVKTLARTLDNFINENQLGNYSIIYKKSNDKHLMFKLKVENHIILQNIMNENAFIYVL
jgi:hypothetical protein